MAATYRTFFNNLSYADIGTVKVTYDDGSSVSNTITTIGMTEFSNDARNPLKISIMGTTYNWGDPPVPATYPDSSVGVISNGGVTMEAGPLDWKWYQADAY